MIEKIRPVSNPLTVIAIFAGLAEVSGSVVLPFLNADSQGKYIWFLMLFPVLLVSLFFFVLWHRHPVLYAPQDYRDEANFNAYISSASVAEIRANKLQEVERANAVEEEKAFSVEEPVTSSTKQSQDVSSEEAGLRALNEAFAERNRRAFLAEDLALSEFQSESKKPIQRNMKITRLHRTLVFDGAIVERDHLNAIEVKFIPANSVWQNRVRAFVDQMGSAYLALPEDLRKGFSATLLLVLDRGVALMQKPPEDAITQMLSDLPFPVTFKTYDFIALEQAAGLRRPLPEQPI